MSRARSLPSAEPVRGWEWLRLLAGFLVIWGALALTGSLDATGRIGLVILAVTVAAAALVEVLLHGTPPRLVLRRLGFGRPERRAMLATAGASLAVLAAYPLFTLATGLSVELRDGWPWLLLGVYASTAWARSSPGVATPSTGCGPGVPSGPRWAGRCPWWPSRTCPSS